MTKQATTLSSTIEQPGFAWLDRLAEPLQAGAHELFRSGRTGMRLKSLLNGTPLRHRLHPALVVWPLGAWTTAAFLDVLDSRASRRDQPGLRAGADASVAFGIAGALPAALAGVADWVDTYDHPRRVGAAHALLNTVALGCYGASLVLRKTGNRGGARALSGVGFGAVLLSSSLGGELVYTLGVNVPHILYPKPPEGYRDVLGSEELLEDRPAVVEVGRVPVLLLRRAGRIFAVQEWCPHAGGPLSEGTFEGDVVECPWHQSRFCLVDGAPLQGPAAVPLRTFEAMEEGGRIFVRPSFEGQSWPPPPKPIREGPEYIHLGEAHGSGEEAQAPA
jgi:nitrite reductase/ring-hydroxylating ferredoxin subunit